MKTRHMSRWRRRWTMMRTTLKNLTMVKKPQLLRKIRLMGKSKWETMLKKDFFTLPGFLCGVNFSLMLLPGMCQMLLGIAGV